MPKITLTTITNLLSSGLRGGPDGAKHWRQRSQIGLLGLALVAGTLACYWPAGHLGFVLYEDPLTVSRHPTIQQGLSWPNIVWAFNSIVTCNWLPLTSLSHMLDCQLFELDAGKHHLMSVFIHAANVLLLFGVLKRMTGAVWRSAFVAALFSWHPMHVESVVWISERKDVLSAFFFLLTLWAYCEYARGGVQSPKSEAQSPEPENQSAKSKRRSRVWIFYGMALGFYALGLMSKPNLVTLPFVLLLLDFWPLRRIAETGAILSLSALRLPRLRGLFWEKLPFLALSVADCVITFCKQKEYGSIPSLEMFPVALRLENALTSYVVYLCKFFWPADMGVFYLVPHFIPLWQAVGAAVLLGAVSMAVVWQARRHPCLATGWFWFMGILVPTIGLVQTGVQSRTDHHTYLAYIGLGLMLAWGVPALLEGFARRRYGAEPESLAKEPMAAGQPKVLGSLEAVLGLAGVAALAGCWLGARVQLGYWQDSVTLFRHTVQVTRQNEAARNMLGAALLEEGRREEAALEFQETLKIHPCYSTFRCRAYDNLGTICLQEHKLDEAIAMLSEALKLKPDSPGTHFNLGAAYGQQGEIDKAAAEFKLVADMATGNDVELNDPDLQSRLARALIRCGKAEEALKHCQDLVASHPEDPAFRSVLAGVCLQLDRPDEAILNLREAIRRAPKTPAYMNQLAGLLAASSQDRLRNGAEAVALAERACALTHHRNAAVLDTLGMAYAEAGRFPEAVGAAEEARTLALAGQDLRGADTVARKLELYRAGKPYHEPPRAN